mmetsp:Transcript_62368/g.76384  ORF Transcript_62368/g.76384 Transcript_62368/m.76384 type:complete len:199 (+) Transcript_62368:93-689(+)
MASNEYKITILGSGGVGKSALTIRLITGGFDTNYDPTIEDSYRKQVKVDGEAALMDILDTAGQDEYKALQDEWIREGDGYLIVYAIDSKESFEEATMIREKIIRILETDNDKIPIVLVANKCDLPENNRVITNDEGSKLAVSWGNIPFYESSAKNNINVDTCFMDCVRQIRVKKLGKESNTNTNTNSDDKPNKCCIIL